MIKRLIELIKHSDNPVSCILQLICCLFFLAAFAWVGIAFVVVLFQSLIR